MPKSEWDGYTEPVFHAPIGQVCAAFMPNGKPCKGVCYTRDSFSGQHYCTVHAQRLRNET